MFARQNRFELDLLVYALKILKFLADFVGLRAFFIFDEFRKFLQVSYTVLKVDYRLNCRL